MPQIANLFSVFIVHVFRLRKQNLYTKMTNIFFCPLFSVIHHSVRQLSKCEFSVPISILVMMILCWGDKNMGSRQGSRKLGAIVCKAKV